MTEQPGTSENDDSASTAQDQAATGEHRGAAGFPAGSAEKPPVESASMPPVVSAEKPPAESASMPPVVSADKPPVEAAATPPAGPSTSVSTDDALVEEPVAEPAAEVAPTTERAPETEQAAETEAEPTAETEPVAEAEPAAEAGPVAEAPAEAEPTAETEPVAEAEPAAEAGPVAEAPAEAEPTDETEPVAEAEPAAEAEPVAETEPAAEAEPAEAPAEAEPTAEAEPAIEAEPAPAPAPRPVPRPAPRPLPRKAAPAVAAAAPPTPPVDAHDAAEAAAWGRVAEDGTVYVREAAGERVVGQYTGADTEEALGFYVRRFLDLQAQVALFEARLPQLAPKEIDQTLQTLTEALAEPAAVGDVDALRARLDKLREIGEERRREAAAEREAARAVAVSERTAIVEKAEAIAEQDPSRTQWKQSGERLRELLDQWKTAQRSGPRLDRPTEDKLWKRFSHARTAFDRHRRQYFSELDAAQSTVKAAKEKLIARAEEMASSTDWGRTAAAYRQLMDEWKEAGRASRKDDDALWARFRAAQQRFFDARSAQNAEVDAEYGDNLKVKLAILEEAEALVPVTDLKAAKAALRPLQDRWEAAGKVPRADVQRVEGRMRAVEQAVRDAEQAVWKQSNPETRARAEGAAAQLESAIGQLEDQLEAARATGDADAVAQAQAALDARRAWLDQIQRTAQG
ncbi:DUF349 domain-containing protein [Georgenia muralis]